MANLQAFPIFAKRVMAIVKHFEITQSREGRPGAGGKMKFRHFRLGNVRGDVNSRIQPWHRYHGFLTIIRERYEAEAKRYDPHPKPGVRVYRVTEDLRERLQLEVETFYLFANMLLDQIAVNVRFFFGFPRGRKTKLHPYGEDGII